MGRAYVVDNSDNYGATIADAMDAYYRGKVYSSQNELNAAKTEQTLAAVAEAERLARFQQDMLAGNTGGRDPYAQANAMSAFGLKAVPIYDESGGTLYNRFDRNDFGTTDVGQADIGQSNAAAYASSQLGNLRGSQATNEDLLRQYAQGMQGQAGIPAAAATLSGQAASLLNDNTYGNLNIERNRTSGTPLPSPATATSDVHPGASAMSDWKGNDVQRLFTQPDETLPWENVFGAENFRKFSDWFSSDPNITPEEAAQYGMNPYAAVAWWESLGRPEVAYEPTAAPADTIAGQTIPMQPTQPGLNIPMQPTQPGLNMPQRQSADPQSPIPVDWNREGTYRRNGAGLPIVTTLQEQMSVMGDNQQFYVDGRPDSPNYGQVIKNPEYDGQRGIPDVDVGIAP